MKTETVKMIRLVGLIVLVILLIALGRSSFFSVSESEQAVLTTFGKYTKTVDAGLHGKLPWPFQQVTILPVNLTQKIELGYGSSGNNQYYSIPEESMMITGDLNIVNIDFFVEWKISDPYKYLSRPTARTSSSRTCSRAPYARWSAPSRSTMCSRRQNPIQADVKEMLRQHLESQDIGVMILDVKVKESEPPTRMSPRLPRVETAKQEKETRSTGDRYKNSKLPEANAQADKIVRARKASSRARSTKHGRARPFPVDVRGIRQLPKLRATACILKPSRISCPTSCLHRRWQQCPEDLAA